MLRVNDTHAVGMELTYYLSRSEIARRGEFDATNPSSCLVIQRHTWP